VTDLPAPHGQGDYRVGVVCLGNICRSPMAEVVLAQRLADLGLDGRVIVDSCGLGGWHVGNPMDRRAATSLARAGYDASRHRARQITPAWVDPAHLGDGHDLLLAMDSSHLDELLESGADPDRVRMFRDFDPIDPGADVPDPYYGGPDGFEEVLAMVERTSDVLAERLSRLFESPGPGGR
jgi:protein-tyrosine phosphatase